VVEASNAVGVLVCHVLFLVPHEAHIAVVWNVKMEPINSKSSCIIAIVSAGVVALTCPFQVLFPGISGLCHK